MYHAHLAKASIDLWCPLPLHHINRDKSIFLEAKFFEDLVALQFKNPGGPIAQYHSVAQEMSMLVCQLLMAIKAEKYKEVAEIMKHTCSIDGLLKQN
jgi:hypothetical protein